MIDRRNISYTQGSPSTPVHQGRLVVKPADSTPSIPSKGLISRATKPKKKVTVLDTIGALGPAGLAKVYVAGGAYGSKEAVKTTITEVIKGQGLPTEPVKQLWETEEWKEWKPKADIPIVGKVDTIQIDPAKPFGFGLPSWEDIKTPLIIGAVALGGLFLAGKFIGRGK
jgi:hypothetical protein